MSSLQRREAQWVQVGQSRMAAEKWLEYRVTTAVGREGAQPADLWDAGARGHFSLHSQCLAWHLGAHQRLRK